MKKFSEFITEGLLNMMKCKKMKKKLEQCQDKVNKMVDNNDGDMAITKQRGKCGKIRDDMHMSKC